MIVGNMPYIDVNLLLTIKFSKLQTPTNSKLSHVIITPKTKEITIVYL